MFKRLLIFVFAITMVNAAMAQDELATEDLSFETSTNIEDDLSFESTFEDSFVDETTDNTISEVVDEQPQLGDGQVVLERPIDYTLSYSERRSRWGTWFSVNLEQFYPINYYSIINNSFYDEFFNQEIPLVGGEFGVKYNFVLGSIAAIVGYSQGTATSEAIGSEITAAISKFALNITLDNLFSQPYVAPYGQFGIHTIDWNEVGVSGGSPLEESFTSEMNYHYKVGMLFQLNWIEDKLDPSSRQEALRSSGLENTYIDVFYTSYAEPAEVSADQNTPGEGNLGSEAFGVGLKIEF